MSELVEFDDFAQMEMLLRAGMELKFVLSADADVLNGSPIYASALNHLREALISGLRSSSTPGRAQGQADWYQLSQHQHRWQLIARRVVLYPHWRDLTAGEMRDWIETLAAPLAVDDGTLEAIKAVAEEMLDGH
ncbi:hypothetical protein V1J52_01270 [Streptomyces sp. TRM 70351]|uniref:hypothetical protein n=1 Tax=Streptomyces sp. TRM 70351 TaxID=3116552 RepID=UPI002E7B59B4|nr:hypothetical protein [Streptomyces sp. TRM 70351]MEE1926824.1 hypothetical protein [Streptomyces sp. TRM 70351]